MDNSLNARQLIGLKIKELRKRHKMTQEKLAELLDMDVGYMSKIEVGLNTPSIDTFERLSNIFKVDISTFFELAKYRDLNYKAEIDKIFDGLSKENQILLYRIAKSLK